MEPFLISERRLTDLSATRQGRISLAGFTYQAAYAVARLASMLVRRPVFDLFDVPIRLRYDWGEDLDERCQDGRVVFTQCKRIAAIGQPALLSSVLIPFAAKWLSVPENYRSQVGFRLVCIDPRFQSGGSLVNLLGDQKPVIKAHFITTLAVPAGERSDRSLWQSAADTFGHERLFDALWEATDTLFVSGSVIDNDPAGLVLPAERTALSLLLAHGRVDFTKQVSAIDRLRRVVHDDLIGFEPANEKETDLPRQSPRQRDAADVGLAIATCASEVTGNLPFEVIDRTFLSIQRQVSRQEFVARQPDWADVVHGADPIVKFVERENTNGLRDAVITTLIHPLERGTDRRLQILFVVGAPGAGKTTLVRRVAAMLVEEGRVVVADAGLDIRDPIDVIEAYARGLQFLAASGRPILFLLDDPLYRNSLWVQLLHKLSRPGFGVAVLSPCPQFLYDRHVGEVAIGSLHRYDIGPATKSERVQMAQLYGRQTAALQAADEFLVIAMEAAAGIPFDEIIRRLWRTLNDGQPIAENETQGWSSLPWAARAFLIVCFFHREYIACPEPILKAALTQDGIGILPSEVSLALSRLHNQQGWRIFRITDAERRIWVHQGSQISTAHQRIADHAWNLRPFPWDDVGGSIITASLQAPQGIRNVVQLATRLAISGQPDEKAFAARLVAAWAERGADIETRRFSDLAYALQTNGQSDLAKTLAPVFRARATPTCDGWIAALQLYGLLDEDKQAFPIEINLQQIIQVADFSIAPTRAQHLLFRLPKALAAQVQKRLLDSFDGKLEWRVEGNLIGMLVRRMTVGELCSRRQALTNWLKEHPDETNARSTVLSRVPELAYNVDELEGFIAETESWIARHPHDTTIRSAYIGVLPKLPSFRIKLPGIMARTEAWLTNHPHDAVVRNAYLGMLTKGVLPEDILRRIALMTEAWLKNHQDDTHVRAAYYRLLRKMRLTEMDVRRIEQDAVAWFKIHPSEHVQTAYNAFIKRRSRTPS